MKEKFIMIDSANFFLSEKMMTFKIYNEKFLSVNIFPAETHLCKSLTSPRSYSHYKKVSRLFHGSMFDSVLN